jgi:cell pole-organizing protein PopZ
MLKGEATKPAPREEPSEVLNLTESMITKPPPAAAPAADFKTIDGEPDVVFREPDPPPAPAAKQYSDALRQPAPERPLISSATSAAVDSAFNTLAHTVLVQNARTLEDLVREMLRPMLKSWLDDNLPSIVERLVRAEIERVSRGRS